MTFPAGAVLHDYFAIRGGGERLAMTLAQGLEWPLVTGFVADPLQHEGWPGGNIRSLGVGASHPLSRTLALIRAWRRCRLPGGTEVALFSGSYAPLAAAGMDHVRTIYYCHSPPRFLYDQRAFFLQRLPVWQRPGFLALCAYFRRGYEDAIRRMDRVVCNSENVRGRLRRYLEVEGEVVYPPVETGRFRWLGQEGYYLSLARLDPLKRVDRIVAAFRRMPERKLIVVSGGEEGGRLRELAEGASNIQFVGWVDDEGLRRLIGQAVATIYLPREEDFGMSPVESMAAGKPVIGVAEGGLLETIVDGKTGILLPPDPSPEAICEAVEQLTPVRARAMRKTCEIRARRFDRQVFLDRMRRLVGDVSNNL